MTLRLSLAAICICLILSSLLAQSTLPGMSLHVVTASEYCNFLNNNAVTSLDYFYSDLMSSDPQTACIMRIGTPGNYFYEVISGKENVHVPYVNKIAEQAYCDWAKLPAPDVIDDIILASNQTDFSMELNESLPSIILKHSSSSSSTISTADWVVIGVASFAACAGGFYAYRAFGSDCFSKPVNPEEEHMMSAIRNHSNDIDTAIEKNKLSTWQTDEIAGAREQCVKCSKMDSSSRKIIMDENEGYKQQKKEVLEQLQLTVPVQPSGKILELKGAASRAPASFPPPRE